MYYWIVIVFVIATMLGLNLSKKDDYRDTVLMPKIEPVISRAVTQHTAAYKYFQASFVANSNNTVNGEADGEKWPELSRGIAPEKNEDGSIVTDKDGNNVIKSMVLKHITSASGTFPNTPLGKTELENFAPYGFDFTARDPDYDPVTRFVCVDRETGTTSPCDTLVLNRVVVDPSGKPNASGSFDPDGKFASVGYLVTYMPIPSMWDTPYYHNMIVNSIKRISDNTLRFGIVKPLITANGSLVAVNKDNVLKYTGREYKVTKDNLKKIYTVGVPRGSTRAIYTVLDEYAVTGRLKDEGLTSSNLIGVFTFIPGQIASWAAADFPKRSDCHKGTPTDKRDVNGMLMFIHRITPMENETVKLKADGEIEDPDKLLIGSYNDAFCPYENTNKDDDAFYDADNIMKSTSAQ